MSSSPNDTHAQALRQIARRFGRQPGWNALILLAGVAQTTATILFAGLLAHVLHALIIAGQPFESLQQDWWRILACLVARALAGAVREEAGIRISLAVRRAVRETLLDTLYRLGPAWREHGLWTLETVDIRQFSKDKRGFLDDTPAGGGPGQVMRADVIAAALDSVDRRGRPLLYMSARGRPLTPARVGEWAKGPGLIGRAGRFEGVDQRVLDARGFEEISVGDAVLAGGEAASLVAIEACVRLVPGVLGQAESLSEESFEDGLLEHPRYTRPREFEGLEIPPVLLSGHHADIGKWRRAQREAATRERRPDLWAAYLANQQAKGE